jgi:hypothetical protein
LVFVSFSEDGRSLAYSPLSTGPSSQIFAVSLEDPNPGPAFVTEGSITALNYDGSHLAFYRPPPDDPETLDLIVRGGAGVEITMEPRGTTAAWSPDGRWLAFNQAFTGSDQERVFFVFDSETGTTREVDRIVFEGSGDFRVSPEWSSTSEYFRHYGARAVSPFPDRAPVDVDFGAWWFAGGNVRRAIVGDGTFLGQALLRTQDLDTGEITETALGEGVTGIGIPHPPFSPSSDLLALVTTPGGPGSPGVTSILTLDGAHVADLSSEFWAWSATGEYLTTTSGLGECVGVTVYRSVDWQPLRCFPHGQFASAWAEFSPAGDLIAYAVDTDPVTSVSVVRLLDLASGREQELGKFVGCIEWSPDARWLVTGAGCGMP